ncbi:AOXA oxidase, partial [Polypterus senegalus]
MVFQGDRIKWITPADLEDLLELKSQYPQAPLVAGNTTVGPDMKFKGILHPVLLNIGRIQELREIKECEDGITLSAACTLTAIKEKLEEAVKMLPEEKSEGLQALLETLGKVASRQIRNVASLGGNILSSNPKFDLCSVLAALGCSLTILSKDGSRKLDLTEGFFTAVGKTALKPEEVMLSVYIPYTKKWEFMSAFRQAQCRQFAFSIINCGMKVIFFEGTNVVKDLKIFYGGAGPTLVSTRNASQQLVGRKWNDNLLTDACKLVLSEIHLPDTAYGGMVEYKKTLILSFFFKFYLHILQKLKAMGLNVAAVPPEYMSALTPLQSKLPQGQLSYQAVSVSQPLEDPVGRPNVHQSGFKHSTGEAIYYDDIPSIDGELFLVFVTSTRPHAKIISIDTAEALSMPGVVTFLSAKDVPGNNKRRWFHDVVQLFIEEEVMCVGQMIGAIVAETREQARRAAQKVYVSYQDLEPVFFTIEEAINHQSFFSPQRKLERGDVDAGFETADQILEGEIYMGGQEHFYMETQGVIAVPKGESGETDLFIATQHAAFAQEVVANALGVSSNKITCHVKRLGGGFGGKVMKIADISAAVAVAAYRTGRSVRCVLERGEDMLITSGRHPFLGKYKVGFMNDGTIISADMTYYSNAGNTLDESQFIIEKALLHLDNCYKIPNLRGRGIMCKTYLPSYTAFRGFGAPQGLMVIESVINEVAAKCGLPAEEVREINMYKNESHTHFRQSFDASNMVRCWNECLEKAVYHQRRQNIEEFNKQNRWKKRGISAVPIKFGIGFSKGFYNQGAALINVYKDGSVLLSHSGTEMGQGINTKMIQIASRILKIPQSSIYIVETSTASVPNAAPSAASFGSDAVGMAVKDACENMMNRLQPIMEQHPKMSWEYWVKEAYIQRISLSSTGFFRGPNTDVDWERSEGKAYYYFTFGVCCSEVEVDCLTGDHKIEGGFVQGLGLYTIEELKFSPSGVLITRGPSQYKIPTICDIPEQINTSLLQNASNPHAIYSSKARLSSIDKCAELSERLDLFHVLFDNMTVLEALKKKPLKEGKLWRVWLKLDCENGRAGVLHTEAAAVDLAKAISESSGIELSGVYAHCGNTYKCSGAQEIQAVAQRTISAVLSFGEKLIPVKEAGIVYYCTNEKAILNSPPPSPQHEVTVSKAHGRTAQQKASADDLAAKAAAVLHCYQCIIIMSDLETCLITTIETFHKYSGKEGDKHKLKKSELKDLINNELSGFLGQIKDQATVDHLMETLDADGDSECDFQEFMTFIAMVTIACHEFFEHHEDE